MVEEAGLATTARAATFTSTTGTELDELFLSAAELDLRLPWQDPAPFAALHRSALELAGAPPER